MSESIDFANNYNDLSTEQGFQFEFICNRCSNGKRTAFKPFNLGKVSGVMDTASNLLGGIFSSAANVAGQVSSAAYERAHDAAFTEATIQMRPNYVQCPRCSSWVCRDQCWNNKKGLCKSCAPDLGVEMAAAQASKSVEEVWAHAVMAEDDKKLGEENWRGGVRATCPECGKALAANVKFCPECGAKIQQVAHCTECGAKLPPGAKFCGECGHKAAG